MRFYEMHLQNKTVVFGSLNNKISIHLIYQFNFGKKKNLIHCEIDGTEKMFFFRFLFQTVRILRKKRLLSRFVTLPW